MMVVLRGDNAARQIALFMFIHIGQYRIAPCVLLAGRLLGECVA